MILLIFLNTLIFAVLSAIHFYWTFGGKPEGTAAIPTKTDGTPLINPGVAACLIVAIGLFVFATIILSNSNLVFYKTDHSFIVIGDWIIVVIFLLRAIGDFRMVGFFKRIKGTAFAENDSKYYSPLCLYLSITTLIIALS